METVIMDLIKAVAADKNALKTVVLLVGVLFARDTFIAVAARLRAKILGDRDPNNDWMADILDVLVVMVKKVPIPSPFNRKSGK